MNKSMNTKMMLTFIIFIFIFRGTNGQQCYSSDFPIQSTTESSDVCSMTTADCEYTNVSIRILVYNAMKVEIEYILPNQTSYSFFTERIEDKTGGWVEVKHKYTGPVKGWNIKIDWIPDMESSYKEHQATACSNNDCQLKLCSDEDAGHIVPYRCINKPQSCGLHVDPSPNSIIVFELNILVIYINGTNTGINYGSSTITSPNIHGLTGLICVSTNIYMLEKGGDDIKYKDVTVDATTDNKIDHFQVPVGRKKKIKSQLKLHGGGKVHWKTEDIYALPFVQLIVQLSDIMINKGSCIRMFSDSDEIQPRQSIGNSKSSEV